MSGNTVGEGYPYPGTSDFADVQDAFRLATAIDADIRSEQAPFRAFESRPSFIVQQVATGSGFLSGNTSLTFTSIKWDNTGGAALNDTQWRQPNNSAPSWWMFGGTLLVAPVSGTPVVGDLNMGRIQVTTTDQVSQVSTSTAFWQRNDETNTGGEWINMFAMAPIYRGSVRFDLFLNGTTTKAIGAGSTFWGFQLGLVV